MKTTALALILLLILGSSCHTPRYIYSPPPPPINYFTQKGDSKVTAYYSTGTSDGSKGSFNRGLDLQAAYAFTNHWAVSLSYYHRSERDIYPSWWGDKNIFDNSRVDYKRHVVEVGAGYFFFINQRKTNTFNIYGGIAGGGFNLNDNGIDAYNNAYNRVYQTNFTKYIIQGGFNFMPSSNCHLSFSERLSYVHFGSGNTSYSPNELSFFNLDRIADKTFFYYEPTFNLQFGIKNCNWIKLDVSATAIVHGSDDSPEVRGLNGSIGITVYPSLYFRTRKW